MFLAFNNHTYYNIIHSSDYQEDCIIMWLMLVHSQSELTIQPQDVAIPLSMISIGPKDQPVIFFYIQLSNGTFVSSTVLRMAIEVSCSCSSKNS